jgi:RNA polymerase sigma factor (sigma-70 family)
MTDTQALLAEFGRTSSETAFRDLVARYLGLVYSAALRLVEFDAHHAEDVAQIVFTDLARMARDLPEEVMLGGWLHRHTCFVAANFMRKDRRRQAHERQAIEMAALHESSGDNPAAIAPGLDEAISRLGEADRQAILLRYFEQRDFRSVGTALGTSEDAARMRVTRALDKLHSLLKRRGVTTTAAALSTVLSTNAIGAVPAGLAGKISAAALVGAALHTASLLTATKAITMTLFQKTLIIATAVALGTGIYQARQVSHLREQNEGLRLQQAPLAEQIARLKSDSASLSNQLALANRSPSASTARLRELLKLRGEVGVLRRQQRELEQTLAAAQPQAPAQSPGAAPRPSPPAPFQVQLVSDEPGDGIESVTNDGSGEVLQLVKAPLLDAGAIQSVSVVQNESSGEPEINVQFSPEGGELFAATTKENIGKRLAIVLGGHLYMAPVIRSEIPGGQARISGNFSEDQANQLAAYINKVISDQ